MNNLWKRLAGITRFALYTIEGDAGGAGGGGAAAGGGGTPTGGDGGSGGGAAPVTPAAGSPSTSSAAAPLSTQEIPSSLTADDGKPVRELGETGESYLARFREYQKTHAVVEPPAKTPAEIAAAAEAERVRLAAATAETPEQKIARETKERAAAAETPEVKAAREKSEKEEADRKAAATTEPGGEIYDLAPIPTETLAAAIKAHPAETAAFLKATGLSEDQLFANSRLAGMAGEYMKAGLGTVQAAKHAVARAAAFHHLDDSFTNLKAGDIPGTGKFLSDVLLPLSYLRDENGQVRVDPETKMPLTDGSVFTFMDNVIGVKGDFRAKQIERDGEQAIANIFSSPDLSRILDAVVAAGKKLGGDRGDMLQAAAHALKGNGRAGDPANDENLPPEVKARLAEADRAKAEAKTRTQEQDERETAAFETKVATFKESVLSESSTAFDKIIGDFLDKTSLKGETFVRPAVIAKIRAALFGNMSEDPLYLSQRDAISLGGPNAKTGKEWVSLNLNEAKARLKTVSEPILTEAKVTFLSRADQRKQEIEGQQKRSQMETHGGTSTALPVAAAGKNDHELVEQARANLRSRGEDIDNKSVLTEFRKLKAQPAA